VHETKSKSFIPFLILIKVHKHKQTGIPLLVSFFYLSLSHSKANTKTNRHLCSFLFDHSLFSFQQMQTQISRQFSFLLYPSLPVTNKNK